MGELEIIRFAVAPCDHGLRLDIWLARVASLSRSRVQGLIRDGYVQAEGKDISIVPKTTVQAHDVFRVTFPPAVPADPQPQSIDLSVIYEDADVIVINKPAGMVVHPAAGHADGTIVNALLHHCDDLEGIGGTLRPGIVHRLDKDTSGILVVAKGASVMQNLAAQFQARTVEKTYYAITAGVPMPLVGTIDTQMGRSRSDRKKMSTKPAAVGKRAVTHYRVLHQSGGFALVELRIETGRTHQIRVHLAHIGCPVAGDTVYGASRKSRWSATHSGLRQMLHAACLTLEHPRSGESMTFTAPIPVDMRDFADACGLSVIAR